MTLEKLSLQTPLIDIKGVGPKFVERLKNLNIDTVKDLLWHFPFRYEDFSNISKIKDLKTGERATVNGVVKDVKMRRTWKKRMILLEAVVADETGTVKAIWFNQKFLITILKKGTTINLAGKVQEDKKGSMFSHPMFEILSKKTIERLKEGDIEEIISDLDYFKHTGRLVPIYPETARLTSKAIRYLIKGVFDNVEKIAETLPDEILKKRGFLEINDALKKIHFPDSLEEAKDAKKRFSFEDLFYLQMSNIRQKKKLAKQKAYVFAFDEKYAESLINRLPFELTGSQKKAIFEVLRDFEKGHPMNRLLQGDVGSGKTIVAIIAALIVARGNKPFDYAQGEQSAFMAPTEVLARQHYQTFKKFFTKFEKGVCLLTSSEAKIFYGDDMEVVLKKPELIKKISFGEIKIIIGTHSLIQKSVDFKDLAFVVIDEQHRFGVDQRAELVSRKFSGENKILPHFLSMSATPIPRTLSVTIFGDLELSIIDELPKNRKPIITKVVAPENRNKVYAFVRGQVKKGRQIFVVCPRIEIPQDEELEKKVVYKSMFSSWEDTRAVKDEYEKLSKKIFPDLNVDMLHGKMKAKEKAEAMKKFKDKKTDILVSTSVIEVGVDIPNATIMMIEGADKFGLAQLYQFRGRVGRGEHQSFCLLFTDSAAKTTYSRLESLVNAKSGFELAEMDLALRGPGQFLGQSQTGIPDLAMKAAQNPEMVKEARESAEEILNSDPELNNYLFLKNHLEQFEKDVHLE
ncbi:MAG: ATP-dependent DNA helicase RecG [Candidatus Wolfebacteria bacterium]|nr:ATP-dependent DNA helicase RecG [Candidatus Wolfebacteria bacterium]